MRLATRLMLAMTTLVLGTAAAGMLGYHSVETAVLPVSLDRLAAQAKARLGVLDIYLRDVRGDVQALRAISAHDGLVRARLAGGIDPSDNTPEAKWRARVEASYVAQLRAKPAIQQLRLIGIADGGREIVRVDRSTPAGPVRVVPDADLQRKGDRPYFRDALAQPAGEVYVSPIDLNQEHGALEIPHVAVQRFATMVTDAQDRPFGIVIVNLDIKQIFDGIRAAADAQSQIYVVNEAGDFLLHPVHDRTFGFDLGRRHRWQDTFPELATAVAAGRHAAVVEASDGDRVAAGMATMRLADGPRIGIIAVETCADIMAPALALRRSALWTALGACGIAIVLAALMARSLSAPLRRITAAVEGFAKGAPVRLPDSGNGEIGILAHAFERMAREVDDKTAALRKKTELFDKTIESMADGFVVLGAAGETIYANAAVRAIIGGREPDIGSTEWQRQYVKFHPDGVTPMADTDTPMGRMKRGENFDNVEVAIHVVGESTLTYLAASGRILFDSRGQSEGGIVVYRNVTAFKETERQLQQAQKMEAVGQLTGGIAHDFNNILTVITGAVEILTDGVKDRPGLAVVAKMIDEAVDRGADLTHQLLSFARKQPLQPRVVDINDMVRDSARLLRPTLGERVEIDTRLAEEPWPALVDPSQLSSALLNLAVNARDAMPSGGKLTLETANVILDETYAGLHAEVQAGPYAMIAVSDTGSGIPAAIRDRVFDPFFTTKAIGKGTGLGLSMVYGFVKQSGGHIKIYSEEGYGTTIKIYLPRADSTSEAEAVVAAPAIVGGRETLLVVEDDELVRKYVITNLVNLGYRVHIATSGAEALALVGDGLSFDLLFTDVVLGAGINGRQLADEVCRLRPGMKVLYTSGYTENAIVHHGRLDAGIRLLTKPYRRADLARMLRLALEEEVMAK